MSRAAELRRASLAAAPTYLARLRLFYHLTVRECCRETGVPSTSMWIGYEQGEFKPLSSERRARIATFFGVEPEALFGP
jgi:transcriptional regulator with XRE-family HTH domain